MGFRLRYFESIRVIELAASSHQSGNEEIDNDMTLRSLKRKSLTMASNK